ERARIVREESNASAYDRSRRAEAAEESGEFLRLSQRPREADARTERYRHGREVVPPTEGRLYGGIVVGRCGVSAGVDAKAILNLGVGRLPVRNANATLL